MKQVIIQFGPAVLRWLAGNQREEEYFLPQFSSDPEENDRLGSLDLINLASRELGAKVIGPIPSEWDGAEFQPAYYEVKIPHSRAARLALEFIGQPGLRRV